MSEQVTATLKLLTMAECIEAQKNAPASPWRDAAVNALNSVWGDDQMHCVLCDQPIGRVASYAAVILPNEEQRFPLCRTGGICLPCGVGRTRVEVHKAALFAAVIAMGDVAGHA